MRRSNSALRGVAALALLRPQGALGGALEQCQLVGCAQPSQGTPSHAALYRREAAVYGERDARHVARQLGGKEQDDLRDLRRFAVASAGDDRSELLQSRLRVR